MTSLHVCFMQISSLFFGNLFMLYVPEHALCLTYEGYARYMVMFGHAFIIKIWQRNLSMICVKLRTHMKDMPDIW